MPKQTDGVIYARYSSHAQREESIEDQLRVCRAYAEREGINVLNVYTDAALTGRKDTRPSYQRMMDDSAKGLCGQSVIIYKTDRVARNRFDALMCRYTLKKHGIRLISATEAIPDTPEGILMESFLDGYAEYYSVVMGQNIKRGMEGNALKCMANGVKVFGYDVSTGFYVPDPVTAPIARMIFTEVAAGTRLVDLCDTLNAQGIRNTAGGEWGRCSLRRMLANEKYIGTYSFSSVRIEGGMPALIDRDLFRRAGRMAKSRQRTPREDVPGYLLTGKVFCGHCGASMGGKSANARGKYYGYYACNNANNGDGCEKRLVPKDEIEGIVVALTRELVSDPETVGEIADAVIRYRDEFRGESAAEALKGELKDTERKTKNLLKALESNYSDAVAGRISALEDEQVALKLRIIEEEAILPEITRDHIMWWLSRMEGKEDIELLAALVSKVTVTNHNDHSNMLEIVYNFKENENYYTIKVEDTVLLSVRLVEARRIELRSMLTP